MDELVARFDSGLKNSHAFTGTLVIGFSDDLLDDRADRGVRPAEADPAHVPDRTNASIVEAIPMTDREHAQFVVLFVPLDLGPVVPDTEAVRVPPG